jgi:hypothetical protein
MYINTVMKVVTHLHVVCCTVTSSSGSEGPTAGWAAPCAGTAEAGSLRPVATPPASRAWSLTATEIPWLLKATPT